MVDSIAPHDPDRAALPDDVDGRGLLAFPGMINAHAHVDKSWWGRAWQSYDGEPSVAARIARERVRRAELGLPAVDTIDAVLRQMLQHGTTALRTHVDVDLDVGTQGIAALHDASAQLGDVIDITIVAFPQDGVLRRPGVLALLEEAARAGATHIGGLDPATIDRDPVGQIDALFQIAERYDVGIDVHLHDPGELGAFQIELIADRTLRSGLQHRVAISHGFAIGDLEGDRRDELMARMAECGVALTTVGAPGAALPPIRQLLEAGVTVGVGTDGIRDFWSPHGDGDLLRVASDLARMCGMDRDDQLEGMARLATSQAAGFVGRASHELAAGSRADIVMVDAENVPDAVVRAPVREIVIAGGVPVVRDAVLTI